VTGLTGQLLLAGCGASVGAGVFVLGRALAASRPSLTADLQALYAPPRTRAGTVSRGDGAGRRLSELARRAGMERALLVDELALVGRPVEAHTTARLLHALTGVASGLGVWMLTNLAVPLTVLLAPALAGLGAMVGVLVADRRVRAVGKARRQEAQLAVAAYIDLVRILLVGGLPLHAALRAAADQGSGWAFGELREALAWAKDRGLAPDSGLERLATELPVPEFADLALTVSSARRGASPVRALESKAAFMRGAEAAQVRTESAVADAQIELPAAVVALAFVFFLTYPLLILLTSSTGVLS